LAGRWALRGDNPWHEVALLMRHRVEKGLFVAAEVYCARLRHRDHSFALAAAGGGLSLTFPFD
jgi:hypothetical protein